MYCNPCSMSAKTTRLSKRPLRLKRVASASVVADAGVLFIFAARALIEVYIDTLADRSGIRRCLDAQYKRHIVALRQRDIRNIYISLRLKLHARRITATAPDPRETRLCHGHCLALFVEKSNPHPPIILDKYFEMRVGFGNDFAAIRPRLFLTCITMAVSMFSMAVMRMVTMIMTVLLGNKSLVSDQQRCCD